MHREALKLGILLNVNVRRFGDRSGNVQGLLRIIILSVVIFRFFLCIIIVILGLFLCLISSVSDSLESPSIFLDESV